jgi:hypothetical protein
VAAVLTALMTFVTCYALTVTTAGNFVVRHGFTTWRSIVNVAATHVPSYGVMWVWPLFGAAAFLLCAGACMALAASQRKVHQSWRLLFVLGVVCLAGGIWAAGHEVLTADPVGDARVRIGAVILAAMCVWLAVESIVVFIGRRPPVAGPDTILQASRNEEEQS